MTRSQKNLWLNDSCREYIKAFAKSHGQSEGKAVEQICKEHQKINETDVLAKAIVSQITDHFKNELTRIRLGTNSIDKNMKINLELLNHLFLFHEYKGDFKQFISTDKKESRGFQEAREAVTREITRQRTLKMEKEKLKKEQQAK